MYKPQELTATGLNQEGFHTVLYGLPHFEPSLAAEHITIQKIETEEQFELFAGVHCVASGLSLADKHHFASNNRGLLHRKGWHLYLAYWRDTPAAVAMLHQFEHIASLTLAATLPDYRGKGLHSALIKHRLQAAHELKCTHVTAQASFGSTSQRNMERAGMKLAWTRAIWS